MTEHGTPQAVRIFFSYAREDQDLRDKLEAHLATLKRLGKVSTWHDRKIGAGRDWAGVISEELEAADIILLLVSHDFLNSEYCYGVEMQRALQREREGNAVVIPVILRPSVWEAAPFGKLQALPLNGRPVTKWGNRDDAFRNIAEGIAEAADRVTARRGSPAATAPRASDGAARDLDVASVVRGMKFALIRPGTFLMGAADAAADQRPVHEVTIAQPFYMGAYVVTQREWKAVMGTEPWKGREFVGVGDNYPAVYITWPDSKTFLARLNSYDPENYYRLPTEAEWEYAARAGTTTRYSFGDEAQALNAYGWYTKNSYEAGYRHAHEVGLKRSNPWGLYDMHGNIWEWVEDWYHGPYDAEPSPDPTDKVLRGGGYDYDAKGATSAFRYHGLPIRTNHVIGFRAVRQPVV